MVAKSGGQATQQKWPMLVDDASSWNNWPLSINGQVGASSSFVAVKLVFYSEHLVLALHQLAFKLHDSKVIYRVGNTSQCPCNNCFLILLTVVIQSPKTALINRVFIFVVEVVAC